MDAAWFRHPKVTQQDLKAIGDAAIVPYNPIKRLGPIFDLPPRNEYFESDDYFKLHRIHNPSPTNDSQPKAYPHVIDGKTVYLSVPDLSKPKEKQLRVEKEGGMTFVKYKEGIEFIIPDLTKNGFKLKQTAQVEIETESQEHYNVLATANKIWDAENFKHPRLPVIVSKLKGPDKNFGHDTPRILDMPIKMPGVLEFKIPVEFKNCRGVIQQIINIEGSLNPKMKDYYAYLTIDNSFVKKEETQRNPGYHTDGFQGVNVEPKVETDRTYMTASHDMAFFYPGPFNIDGLDPAKHNFFSAFEEQIEDDPEEQRKSYQPEPYDVCLLDAYTMHCSAKSTITGTRRFLRVSFSKRIFDRLGNTPNPMYHLDWEMKPKKINENLI